MKLSAPFWSFERTETSFFKLHHGEISLRLAPTVAPLTTVALVMPGAVAQPATPRTMAPFAPGRIKIEVFPAGAFVRPFESFDAVGAGVADMCHSTGNYWETKSPAFTFFAAMPFGFTADERALQ